MLSLPRTLVFLALVFVSIFACGQTLTIVSPKNGSTVSSPVRVVANFSSTAPIETITILLDGVQVAQPDAVTPLDINVPMSAGNHLLTVNAVQADGVQLSDSRNVDVSAPVAAMSTAASTSLSTSTATTVPDPGITMSTSGGTSTISDIEQKSGWYEYPDQGNPDCNSKPYLVSSPSIDGTSGRFHLDPTGQFNNCLWPIRLGTSTATHFKLEVHYQLSKPSVSQGIEFSSNKHVNTTWYKFSVQCSYYKGVFSVWDTANSKWVATSIPCKRPAANTWQDLIVQTEIYNGKAVFKSITVNGVTYTVNKSFNPRTSTWANSFGVHVQMNGNRSGDSYYLWVDNLKFSLW